MVEPPYHLVELASLLHERAGLDQNDMEHLEMFQTTALDPVVCGSTKNKIGASVGLPYTMLCKAKEDLDLNKVIIKPHWHLFFEGFRIAPDANPDDLDELKDSMVLSDAARSFIVSKCMYQSNSYNPIFQCFLPGYFVLLNFIIAKLGNWRITTA